MSAKWEQRGYRAECKSCNWKSSARHISELQSKVMTHYQKSGHMFTRYYPLDDKGKTD